MGILASLRSSVTSLAVGIVVTASHHPEEFNGLRLVDPDGEIVGDNWSKYAERLANCDWKKVTDELAEICKNEKLSLLTTENPVQCCGVRGPKFTGVGDGDSAGHPKALILRESDVRSRQSLVFIARDTRKSGRKV
jgi:hypothetical protein